MPFGFHPTYLIILLIVVLIIFGPGKLPELGSAIGRGIREFRRESDKIVDEVRSSASEREPGATPASSESGKAEAERKS